MSQAFTESGVRVPVTLLKVETITTTKVKDSKEKDGYSAVQFGFGGEKRGKKEPRFLREVRVNGDFGLKVGDKLNLSDVLSPGDTVSVTSTSKGKGFAGGVKRWGFAGGPKTHGQSDRLRAPGSIGQGTTPGRVHKGKKMAGRMGGDTVTVKNLKVVSINEGIQEVLISGPVPGVNGSLVTIKRLSLREEKENAQ